MLLVRQSARTIYKINITLYYYRTMSIPGPSYLGGYPELSEPVNVEARLTAIETELAINRGLGYDKWDRCMAQNASVLSLVNDVYNQEVVSRRNQTWKNIADIVQKALPFYVDTGVSDFLPVVWAFHNWEQPLGERNREDVTDIVLRASLYLGDNPDGQKRTAKQAAIYAAQQPTFKKRTPQPVLGVAAHQIKRNVYQFQPAELLQRVSETAIATTDGLTALFHDGLDYYKPSSNWHTMTTGDIIASARDQSGSVGSTQQSLKRLANSETDCGSLVNITDRLIDKGIVRPRQVYDYLHSEYTTPHQSSLAMAEELVGWLSQDMVAPVTPGSLPPKVGR
jgi:hypothetical protein